MTNKRIFFVSESRETMFCPISIHGEFPDLPIGLWRKGERCRLDTVGCETLTVFSMPRIRKNGQCLEVQVDKTFLEFLSEITIF